MPESCDDRHTTGDENEERARMAFDAARMGAFDYDLAADRTKFFGNFHSLFGWPQDRQHSNLEFLQAIHADDRQRMVSQATLAVEGGSSFELEYRVVWPDGSLHWIAQKATVLRDQAGAPVRMVGVAMDIDDRKRAEEERERLDARVQQAQKLETLGTLAGGVAHDFNNLLQAILGNTSIIRLRADSSANIQNSLEQIEIACQRASELTNQLLAYAGKGRLVVEAVDLSQLAMEMSKLLESSLPHKPRLQGQFTPGLPAVGGDPTQLRQVVMNLVINAAESLPENNGVIRLSTGAVELSADDLSSLLLGNGLVTGTYVYFEVCDTGCGMTEEIRSKVFDPFFTTKQSGRGLGLAAVLGIVRGHRGALQVHSEAGSGTVFRVLFPALGTSAINHPATYLDQSRSHRAANTILVVDDEPAIRNSAKLLLESLGFSVVTASDGLDALEIFRTGPAEFCAVLLDLTMPNMSGAEAFHELRKLRADVPILVTSGFSGREPVQEFHETGRVGFIQKPYRGSELKAKLLEVLGRAKQGDTECVVTNGS